MYVLLKSKVKGIKNIEEPIEISYYSKNISKINVEKQNVKGIFGRNGIGKTSIIKAIDIIKKIVTTRNYIYKNENILKDLINKNSKEMEVELEFYNDDNKLKIINHKIILKYDDEVKISYERIQVKTLKNKVVKEIVQKDGIISKINNFGVNIDKINNEVKNLLYKQSMITVFIKKIKNNLYFYELFKCYFWIITVFHLDDRYENLYGYNIKKKDFENILQGLEQEFENKSDLILNKEYIEEFKKDLISLTNFVKLIIPTVENISYEISSQDENKYYINYIVEYEKYKITLKYESMGLKNLIKLYTLIKLIYIGCIVFIDEIDLSIHEVYLEKIIECVANYSKGQLVFTAHNIGLLEVLNNFKNSIDFIDSNQKVKSWVQRGTANPIKYYKNGKIENMVFNIEDYEFDELFSNEI